MILFDREILFAVHEKFINIDPLPPIGSKAWTSTAVDLRLDDEIRPWTRLDGGGQVTAIDPTRDDFNSNKLIGKNTKPVSCELGFVLNPNAFVLGWTIEKVKLPHTSRMAARVEGKSSLARIGLGVHVTAPTIHAGFGVNDQDRNYTGSPIRLEIWNAGPLEILLKMGMPICQLIIEEVHGTPESAYKGAFAIQGPTG